MSWPAFFGGLAVLFLLTNVLFGSLYWLSGDGLENVRAHSTVDRFLDCFFFSVQTLATIGYGKIDPIGTLTNLLVTLEALLGMLFVPVATGLVFVRLSRPTAKVRFSRNALIRTYDGEPHLVFRVANARMNQIIDAEIRVTLIHAVTTADGGRFREFKPLALSQSRTPPLCDGLGRRASDRCG
jgi:inward rectifier potassium channel